MGLTFAPHFDNHIDNLITCGKFDKFLPLIGVITLPKACIVKSWSLSTSFPSLSCCDDTSCNKAKIINRRNRSIWKDEYISLQKLKTRPIRLKIVPRKLGHILPIVNSPFPKHSAHSPS